MLCSLIWLQKNMRKLIILSNHCGFGSHTQRLLHSSAKEVSTLLGYTGSTYGGTWRCCLRHKQVQQKEHDTIDETVLRSWVGDKTERNGGGHQKEGDTVFTTTAVWEGKTQRALLTTRRANVKRRYQRTIVFFYGNGL